MKEIVDRLNEQRQIEVAKSILEAEGYEVKRNEALKDSEEEYDGITTDINPFREYTNHDYRSYEGPMLPDGSNPLIYDDERNPYVLLITGDEDGEILLLSFLPDDDISIYEYYQPCNNLEEALNAARATITKMKEIAPEDMLDVLLELNYRIV